MNRKRNLILLVLAVVLFMLAAPIVYLTVSRASIPNVELPIPNGFDTLKEAGEITEGLPDEEIGKMTDVEAIRTVLHKNEMVLQLIEKATKEAYVVPIDYNKGGQQKAMDEGLIWRTAARLSLLEIRLAELEGKQDDQATLLTRFMALTAKTKNEGLLFHFGSSAGNEKRSLMKLIELAPTLSAETKDHVRNVVIGLERKRTDFDEIMEREHALVEQEYGMKGKYMIFMTRNWPNEAMELYKAMDAEVVTMSEELLTLLNE